MKEADKVNLALLELQGAYQDAIEIATALSWSKRPTSGDYVAAEVEPLIVKLVSTAGTIAGAIEYLKVAQAIAEVDAA